MGRGRPEHPAARFDVVAGPGRDPHGGAVPGLAEECEEGFGVPVLVEGRGAGVAAVHDTTWSPDAPAEAKA